MTITDKKTERAGQGDHRGDSRSDPQVVYVVDEITPAKAEQYLLTARLQDEEDGDANGDTITMKTRVHNRRVSEKHVREMAEDMLEHHFYETGQGISFDRSGRLIDGQQRLWAIIRSGIPQRIVVAQGVADEAFMVLDEHRKRSAGDILYATGEKGDVTRKAAAARTTYKVMIAVQNDIQIRRTRSVPASATKVAKFFRDEIDQKLLDEAVLLGGRAYHRNPEFFPTSLIAGVYLGTRRYGEVFVNDFYEVFATHIGLLLNDPLTALVEKGRNLDVYTRGEERTLFTLAFILKAMQKRSRDEGVKVLKLGPNENFKTLLS